MSEPWLYCEGCNEKTLTRVDETCPKCGTENGDQIKAGWDNKQ